MRQVDPEFIAGLLRTIEYLHGRVTAAGHNLTALDPLKENFYQVVEWGLKYEETWRPAAELALALFHFVETRAYGREWRKLLMMAAAWCETGNELLHGRLLNRLGQLFRITKQHAEALELLKQGLQLTETTNDIYLRAEIHRNMAVTYWDQRDHVTAEQHARLSYQLFEELNNPRAVIVLNILGLTLRGQGDYEAAIDLFHEAITRLEQAGNQVDVGRIMLNLGETYRLTAQYDEAAHIYQELIDRCEQTGDLAGLTGALLNLGTVYASQGNYEGAAQTFIRIDTNYLSQCGDLTHLAMTYNNLGYVRCQLGQYKAAEVLLNESLQLREQLGDEIRIANTLDSLANLYKHKDENNKAIVAYEKAIALLKKYPHDSYAKILLERYEERWIRLVNETDGQG